MAGGSFILTSQQFSDGAGGGGPQRDRLGEPKVSAGAGWSWLHGAKNPKAVRAICAPRQRFPQCPYAHPLHIRRLPTGDSLLYGHGMAMPLLATFVRGVCAMLNAYMHVHACAGTLFLNAHYADCFFSACRLSIVEFLAACTGWSKISMGLRWTEDS